ncbi:hypothetical protein DFH29DRAFT_1022852 [Suillus ampliporus]|nr:hypothetical protein DFH29DRAFT_1022852 [Suillus ampliporus]
MGPSDATTTHALLTQIITLMVMNSHGNPVTDAYPLPVPPAYSNGQVWFQTLAYSSLSFSLLAAFGAVLGKQWLRIYKLKRFGCGSLEEQGARTDNKNLTASKRGWHLDAVLQTFPVLLEISLLLFGISLSAYVWTQQRTITSIIIATTGLGTRARESAHPSALISAMESSSPRRLRYAALRAVSDSRLALADMDAIQVENIRQKLLTKFSPALLTAICPMTNPMSTSTIGEMILTYGLVMAHTSNMEWCKRLVTDRHIGYYCISILNNLDENSPAPFHLTAIFGRVRSSNPDAAETTLEAVTADQFPSLVKSAWQAALDLKLYNEAECITAFPAIIKCAEQKDISAANTREIRKNVGLVMEKLKRRNKCPEVTSSIQDYYTTLTKT